MTSPERFSFRFDPRYARLAKVFGIRPQNAWVEVGDTELVARYGRWGVRTPLSNIIAVELTGPYQMIKTAGPARLGLTDIGLTFAGNRDRGVLITFRERVRGIARFGPLTHGELTVTVADTDGLVRLLRERAGL